MPLFDFDHTLVSIIDKFNRYNKIEVFRLYDLSLTTKSNVKGYLARGRIR